MSTRQAEHDVVPGELIAGKYRVERVIGTGGMGIVVAATHVDLGQAVALKFMQPSALGDEDSVARFLREARAVVRLKSEHVGRVLDLGRLDTGSPFIVMEYLEGEDLDHLVERRGPLALEVAVLFILQALEAVAEAHSLGIIHRDLKPANLFLTHVAGGAASVKVLDFGVSKYREPEGTEGISSTLRGTMLGSPFYTAPEQLMSASAVDGRADIWSVGCSIYQLVTGTTPFTGQSVAELTDQVIRATPRPLRLNREQLPEAFEAVVMRCLSKAPEERYADAADLAFALVPFGPPAANALANRVAAVLGRAPRRWRVRGAPRSSVRGLVWAGALSGAGAALAIAYFSLRRPPRAPVPPVPASSAETLISPLPTPPLPPPPRPQPPHAEPPVAAQVAPPPHTKPRPKSPPHSQPDTLKQEPVDNSDGDLYGKRK